MTATNLVYIALLVPILGAIGIARAGRWPNIREAITIITGITLVVAVFSLLMRVFDGEQIVTPTYEIISGVELGFAIEPLGMIFACIASSLWLINSIYAIGYMRGNNEPRQTSFYVCFAVAISSAIGIAFERFG